MRKILVVTLVVAVGLAFVAGAQAAGLAYRTDRQAEQYLQHQLPRWGGVNLTAQDFKFASCMNGHYSSREGRTGRQFPERMNLAGENIFHTFDCTLGAAGHSWNLYLVALPHGHWSVSADR